MNSFCKYFLHSVIAMLALVATTSLATDDYLVIDVSAGYGASYPVVYYDLGSLPLDVTNDLYKTNHILLKKISAGTFMMGSPTNEPGRPLINANEDLHQVTLTQDYYVGVFEVTEIQWNRVTDLSGTSKKPIKSISYIAQIENQFLAQLNSGVDLGEMTLDLPTEAQWEYVCRAGTTTPYSFGSYSNQLQNYAWYLDYDGNRNEVGLKIPNIWGVYDLHGNMAEFCRDAYNASLGTNSVIDPLYVSGAAERVTKGGGYNRSSDECRSAFREGVANGGGSIVGFRISVTIPRLYDLAVINGSGSGSYTNNHLQVIVANAPPPWYEFDQWIGDVAGVGSVISQTTTVTISGADLSVEASYKALTYQISITNGSSSVTSAVNAQVVTIYADPPAETNVFERWEGSVTASDMFAPTATVTVAGADISMTALYRHAPFWLSVTTATGVVSSRHYEGEVVPVQAAAPSAHYSFLWVGDAATIADPKSWETTLVMPPRDIGINATYPDKLYTLTVVNGSGSGSYATGTAVNVSISGLPSDLHVFEKWSGDTAGLDLIYAESAVFTMPGIDASLIPLYKPIVAVKGDYMEVNLTHSGSAYEIIYMDTPPPGGWDDSHKDTKMAFKRIDPASYQMGSGDAPSVDEHTVTLTEAFYVGIYEVTQGQWENVMGDRPSLYTGTGRDYHPVENISYDRIRGDSEGREWPATGDVDSSSFVGQMRVMGSSDGFDLPTEAQWEYACRAGTTGNWYVDSSDVFDVAIVSVYGQPPLSSTAEVGSLAPNEWKLYDSHGNVFELCCDWFDGVPLGTASQTDPPGAASSGSDSRVIKGGSFELIASPYSKSGYRAGQTTNLPDGHTGFRMSKAAGVPNQLTLVDSKVNTGGNYYYRAQIGISAVEKVGQEFDYWLVTPAGIYPGSGFDAGDIDTVITMPNQSITVQAYYK